MTPDEHKAVIRRYIQLIFDERRPDRADECVAPDFIDHSPSPGQPPGLAGAKQKWAAYLAAAPDLRVSILEMIAEGDRVAVYRKYEGTQRGELMGIPPTGKQFQITGFSMFRLAEGKVAEHWELLDRLALLQQLGAIAAPTRPGTVGEP